MTGCWSLQKKNLPNVVVGMRVQPEAAGQFVIVMVVRVSVVVKAKVPVGCRRELCEINCGSERFSGVHLP